jgi:hypothetical protein
MKNRPVHVQCEDCRKQAECPNAGILDTCAVGVYISRPERLDALRDELASIRREKHEIEIRERDVLLRISLTLGRQPARILTPEDVAREYGVRVRKLMSSGREKRVPVDIASINLDDL